MTRTEMKVKSEWTNFDIEKDKGENE